MHFGHEGCHQIPYVTFEQKTKAEVEETVQHVQFAKPLEHNNLEDVQSKKFSEDTSNFFSRGILEDQFTRRKPGHFDIRP